MMLHVFITTDVPESEPHSAGEAASVVQVEIGKG